jgi:hypothetical protein
MFTVWAQVARVEASYGLREVQEPFMERTRGKRSFGQTTEVRGVDIGGVKFGGTLTLTPRKP